ncbi:SpoIIE family protein phosphatase [Amycolatopsis vancoresmycina]|uniref:Regulator of sigma subunit, anti-anti-sigma factor RsbU n=1 Tax=Amycolatopsis vancoresmycina DSM 44592 TaxID=1292037 RepID=R1HT34_9PSEU|nr:SpoIIE family protein phosphatase [Amycolatopsis vancoresmycina]EOD66740.1 regulator of sigma subunit, anti-anti-sigma factor RsbU [Amycolatopsis vancoresmycina DSM 44592]
MTSDGGDHDPAADRRIGRCEDVRRVFDAMPVLVLGMAGPELEVTATTAAYRVLAGRSEMIGVPFREVFPETMGQQIFEMFAGVHRTGNPVQVRAMRAQFEQQGRRIEVFVDVIAVPQRGADGEITGVIAQVTDVTEQERERLATQERANVAEARYAQARGVIDTLQRELLPAGVPVLPRVELAASYLLADADTAAGGDWYDAIALPGGHVALVVGDVVGHGVAASATMGRLRIVLEEHLAGTGDVLAAVRAADAATDRIPGARATTVCVAVLDPATGLLTYTTAGHPPPLIVPAGLDDGGRYLETTAGGPLGTGGERVAATARLATGDLVLLYTDGILERPGQDLGTSTVDLARVAADVTADRALPGSPGLTVERVCEQTIELMIRATGHTDDITLLAAQLTPAPAAFALTVPADTGFLATIRTELDDWLDTARVGRADSTAIRHAVVELATNVMDHAYLDAPDLYPVTVTADLTDTGRVELRVADQGRWREPRPSPDRGLGLHLTSDIVDVLQISHDARGTTAFARHRLTRPARLLTAESWGPASSARPAPQADPLIILDQPSAPRPRIRVDGPIDGATAGTVEHEILAAGATGARSLTVDLTGVTHLASAGVAVLHRLAALHRGNETELVLFAPVGSNADMITTLVDLAHRTLDPDDATR